MIYNNKNFDDIINEIRECYHRCKLPIFFDDYEEVILNKKEGDFLLKMLEKGIIVYEFDNGNVYLNRFNDREINIRGNMSALVNKNIIQEIINKLSQNEKIIIINDHLNKRCEMYYNGISKLIDYNLKIITSYEVSFCDIGNPRLHYTSFITDFGSEIERFQEIIKNDIIIKNLWENYLDITIVDRNFYKSINIIKEVHNIIFDI